MGETASKRELKVLTKDLVGLARSFSVNPSSCKNPEYYQQYIFCSAMGYQRSGDATTHVVIEDDRIVGFISLRASTLTYEVDNGRRQGEPSIEIYVLAVDKEYECRGVGTMLVAQALAVAYELHKYIGVKNIILAADPEAVGFYSKMGFVKMDDYMWQTTQCPFETDGIAMYRDLKSELQELEPFSDTDIEE